jgi:hypothetical protein
MRGWSAPTGDYTSEEQRRAGAGFRLPANDAEVTVVRDLTITDLLARGVE